MHGTNKLLLPAPGIGHNGGPEIETELVWKYIPDSSQELAINSPAHVTLFTGARGPGKTDTQLMHFRRYVGQGYGQFWRGVLFDREYKMLDDIVSKSKRWFPKFEDGCRFLESKSDYKWVWPTGEELMFRSIDNLDDYWNYHGQEFPWIGWNELTKWPTLELFDRMMSCNRSSFTEKDWPIDKMTGEAIEVRPIPLRVFATTNPYGVGHNAVRRRFIDPVPYGEIVKKEIEVFNPATKEDVVVTKTQVSIFGSWRENPYLSPEYVADIVSIKDPNIRAAWDQGRWDIVAGGALDDVWDSRIHVIERFPIPDGWFVNRTMDWGSSHPYSVGFWAEANGEEVKLPNGFTFCPAPGSLILFAELYGTQEIGTNKGLKKGAKALAEDIDEYEQLLVHNGWIPYRPEPGPADNQIRDVRDSETETIEKRMGDVGIYWTPSDKAAGSRKNGLQLIRDRLEAAKTGEGPGLYIMRNCAASVETIPNLPRDPKKPDDVDTTAEDHAYDMVRYRVLAGNDRSATNISSAVVR